MIVYKKKFVRIAECWSDEEPLVRGVDLVRLYQQSQPMQGMVCRDFYTVMIDLRRDLEDLLRAMKRDTRYDIRRASTSDELLQEIFRAPEQPIVDEFSEYYDRFASQKGLPRLNRVWLSLLSEGSAVTLSRVNEANGGVLVWHAYHCTNRRATLLYSASLFRSLNSSARRNRVARANRFQHWEDIKAFKKAGVSIYDLGGWYAGHTDSDRLNINRFKEEFGGQIVKTYICERAITVKAKAFLRMRQLLLGNAI